MAKHRNGAGSNKKNRNVGPMSISKHRISGRSRPNKIQRIILAKQRNEDEAAARARRPVEPMYDSAEELFSKH